MNGYNLIRAWYNFKFENPDKAKAKHSDFYCYLVDQWNRLGQKNNFGLPTSYTMECLGISSYNTYKGILDDLIEFGFVKLVKNSKNQHQSKIIALSNFDKALDKALDKATAKAPDKALDTISKQVNNETIEQKKTLFDRFWNLYNKKVDKKKTEQKWMKLDIETMEKIISIVPDYVKVHHEEKYRKHPTTFLNNESWNDELKPKQTASDNWLKVIS
jgi:hypothetical protein